MNEIQENIGTFAGIDVPLPVFNLDRHGEMPAVHDQRSFLEQGPLCRIVKVGKTDEAVDQGQHIGLVEDQTLHLVEVFQDDRCLVAFVDQLFNACFENRVCRAWWSFLPAAV